MTDYQQSNRFPRDVTSPGPYQRPGGTSASAAQELSHRSDNLVALSHRSPIW